MRAKFLAVFSIIVLIVGGLSYALVRANLDDLSTRANRGEAPRALAAGSAQLQVDALRAERWLAALADEPYLREPYTAGTQGAREEAATAVANRVRDAAAAAAEFAGMPPTLVALTDRAGVVLGRNGSNLMRREDLGAPYPALRTTLARGASGVDLWISRRRNEQMVVAYAAVRGAGGETIGGVLVGTPLNDERLTRTSERTTSNRSLILAIPGGETLDVVARSSGTPLELLAAITRPPARDLALGAQSSGQTVDLGELPGGYAASARAVDGFGDGRRGVMIAAVPPQGLTAPGTLLYPMLGVVLLGLVLVFLGAQVLDGYLSGPVSELEDGLLAIMNGKTDLRFEIEHAELGGLVFRLNSLLNQLFGVVEDDTDAEGRPSHGPTSRGFEEALSVDERMAALSLGEVADAAALRAESDEAYYRRIFGEYVAAKREIGDPVDHITEPAFVERIRASERELADRHGKPVRYRVEVREKEVVLFAVPLA